MKKTTVLTIVLTALDEVINTSKSSVSKKHKIAEDTTTIDKSTKPTKPTKSKK